MPIAQGVVSITKCAWMIHVQVDDDLSCFPRLDADRAEEFGAPRLDSLRRCGDNKWPVSAVNDIVVWSFAISRPSSVILLPNGILCTSCDVCWTHHLTCWNLISFNRASDKVGRAPGETEILWDQPSQECSTIGRVIAYVTDGWLYGGFRFSMR